MNSLINFCHRVLLSTVTFSLFYIGTLLLFDALVPQTKFHAYILFVVLYLLLMITVASFRGYNGGHNEG